MSDVLDGDRTLKMTVANTGFMLDRLGQDCSPLQFLRELTQNAIEGIAASGGAGEIVWDVDEDQFALTDVMKLCVIDTGVGMTGEEMVRYINQLSSSAHEQSHEGNFGVGAKIAAATRNHAGLVYLSWKDSVGYMIHLWRDPATGEYGLRQFERPDGTFGHWAFVEDSVKPKQIGEHGTKVVLLGNDLDQNSMTPPPGAQSPSRWVSRYLNTRYFRFPEVVTVRAREGWENPRSDTDRNVLRTLTGQQAYLATHSQAGGTVDLTDGLAHWWILKDEKALTQNSGFVASSGHMAALHRDELYEMVTARAGVARLQLFGVIFGYQRIVIYVEPAGGDLKSNTARTQLLMNGEPLPWADWAAEFRSPDRMPQEIKDLMDEVVSGSHSADHQQAIRERLKQIRDLFRLSRYRPTPKGRVLVDDSGAGGSGRRGGSRDEAAEQSSGGRGGRAGNIYALFLTADGVPADPVRVDQHPETRWISVGEGTRASGFLEDRAAKYLVEQNILQINGDFRVFTDMIDRWCDFYGDRGGARETVQDVVREWFEQALVETVLGVQTLNGSAQWTISDIGGALSEEALTAAVMPRYHIDVAIKRALGAKLGTLKDRVS